MVLGEMIQTLWNAIQGNQSTVASPELKDAHDTTMVGGDLTQGQRFLQFRDNKIIRGAEHMHMLTSPDNEDVVHDFGVHDFGVHDFGVHDFGVHDAGIEGFIPTHFSTTNKNKNKNTSKNNRKRMKRLRKMQGQ